MTVEELRPQQRHPGNAHGKSSFVDAAGSELIKQFEKNVV